MAWNSHQVPWDDGTEKGPGKAWAYVKKRKRQENGQARESASTKEKKLEHVTAFSYVRRSKQYTRAGKGHETILIAKSTVQRKVAISLKEMNTERKHTTAAQLLRYCALLSPPKSARIQWLLQKTIMRSVRLKIV